ncbi:glycoside hydrolase family 3 [Pyrrhoderma noxium]|uniref:beta-glucosidase n=1 Tax=Pyrrhoderma noxium TaxID=2282107 RepID=A0A286UVJ9_9AGAM|nr:glycoside hydrolase family 3 [Pyrrhoderma noxium]
MLITITKIWIPLPRFEQVSRHKRLLCVRVEEADIDNLIKELTLDEKISLISSPDWWNTNSIKRLGIPSVRMSDGPNGVRGSSAFVTTPAQCLPCATALASTFDIDLIFKVGEFLANEAKLKSSTILLAPTCNIQRSPLGGRSFESFSEDPTLSGLMAASYINGLQSRGVAATIKHFVANDQEHERTAVNSVVSERALREIYLYPFMLSQIIAKPWAFMTSYGRIDGIHCSENPRLLTNILRNEWKFEGLIMSDWYGTYGVDAAIKAGLDLEMPGPPRWRTHLLTKTCLGSQKISIADIEARAKSILNLVQKLARKNPDIVYGDGRESTGDSPESRNFCRNLVAETMVLLKNKDNVLPLYPKKAKTVAVIGPHVKSSIISGGGSAALTPAYTVTPWDGFLNGESDITFKYHLGCYAHKFLPTIESLLKTRDGKPGWLCTFFNVNEHEELTNSVAEFYLKDTRIKLSDFLPEGLGTVWGLKLSGLLCVDKDMLFELGLTVAGRGKLFINDKLLIDNWTQQKPGEFFYGQGSTEKKASITLVANSPVNIEIIYICTPPPERLNEETGLAQPALMRGLRLGGAEVIDERNEIEAAAALASVCDAAIVVGGLTPEWEAEGFDRPDLTLPGRQNDLIEAIGKANSSTIVVIQAGSAVSMPWIKDVKSVIHAWYSGNEAGNGIADIVLGKKNPSGKLPLTFPVRIEDTPSYLSFGSENGHVVYSEDLFVGYKYYQSRKITPLFSFGYGLSYTEFELSEPCITSLISDSSSFSAEVTVKVTNTGKCTGSEVVQLYVSLPKNGTTTPRLQLRGFAKAKDLHPGQSEVVVIQLDKYAISFWDTPIRAWRVLGNSRYNIFIGKNSEELPLSLSFELQNGFVWAEL